MMSTGRHTPLNLGPLFDGRGSYLPLKLGVSWDVDPPDPVIRGIRTSWGSAWAPAMVLRQGRVASWNQSAKKNAVKGVCWLPAGLRSNKAFPMTWELSPRARLQSDYAWLGAMSQVHRSAPLSWTGLLLARGGANWGWRTQSVIANGHMFRWLSASLWNGVVGLAWQGRLRQRVSGHLMRWLHPGVAREACRLPWAIAERVPWLVRRPQPVPPDPEPSPFPMGSKIGLNLACPTISHPGFSPLNLGVTACYAVRPQRETHIVLNTISVVRIPDRTPIAVESIGISGSCDGWGFSFDIGLANGAHLTLLKPTSAGPRQIEITLNGYVWTAIIESYSTRREWNTGGVSLTGRSRTALLASPYAPIRARVNVEDRSVAQLVGEELADTGYTASYDTVDWLVPMGAWFYDASTPLDAISALAEASGAVVQSDPATLELRVRPRYPISPWLWRDSAPDVIIQDDIITGENLQVRSAPLYDAVVVTGELAGKGVTCKVKRAGEAGDSYAPQVSSALITVVAAGTERGRNVLSDRGEQASIDLTLPLFAAPLLPGQTGRVLPLDLVEVQTAEGTWHGLCTAVRIEARRDDKAVVIEQTVTLERHYTDAN